MEYALAPEARLEGKLIGLRRGAARRALVGGTLVDAAGRREGVTVLVRGDTIEELLPAGAPIPESETIDCAGATVLPGMFDLHVHLMGTSERDRARSHLVPPPGLRILRHGFEAYQLLAHGFTTILDLGHGDAEHVFGLREAIAEGTLRGPRILHVGWYLAPTHESESGLPYPHDRQLRVTMHASADGRDEIRELLGQNAAEGAEWTKLYFTAERRPGEPWYTPGELAYIVERSHRLGMRVACHAKSVDAVRAAIDAGIDCIEHGPDVVDRDLLALMAERGTALVPTLAVYERVSVVAEEFEYPPARVAAIQRELEGRMRNVRAAREAGVRIGVGSDVGARGGFGMLSARELALLGECGFSPLEAITAATASSARIVGLDADLGTIAPGKLAELVVVDGDPLADIGVLQRAGAVRYVLQASDRLRASGFAGRLL